VDGAAASRAAVLGSHFTLFISRAGERTLAENEEADLQPGPGDPGQVVGCAPSLCPGEFRGVLLKEAFSLSFFFLSVYSGPCKEGALPPEPYLQPSLLLDFLDRVLLLFTSDLPPILPT
jgi:hypothetical protein